MSELDLMAMLSELITSGRSFRAAARTIADGGLALYPVAYNYACGFEDDADKLDESTRERARTFLRQANLI